MKKLKLIGCMLGTFFSISVCGTVLGAPNGLFAVVPAKHWSYEAIAKLAEAGLADGFGGSAYREDIILTRFEMAAIVSKAMARADKASAEEKAIIDKLYKEFATELNFRAEATADQAQVEKRLEKLKAAKPGIKLSGDTRVRYQSNWNQASKDSDPKTSRIQQRVRLNISSEISKNLMLLTRLNATNESNKQSVSSDYKTAKTNSPVFDRAELQWKNGPTTVSLGRFLPSLGQGIIWDYNSVDGVLATYDFGRGLASAGYGDLAAYTGSGSTTNAFLANLKIKADPHTNLSIAHLNTMTTHDAYYSGFKQTAYGFQTRIGEVTITGEYVKNSDGNLPAGAQDHGIWGRVLWKGIDNSIPGSFGLSLDYLKLGNYAVNSYWNPGILVVSGGNGIGKDGAKGFGLGVQYVFAKNANVEARYYWLKPYEENKAGFDKYKPSYHLITNYRF